MSRSARPPLILLLAPALAASLALVAGCQIVPEPTPDPTRFYVLNSPAADATPAPTATGVTLGLRPVTLPGYLRSARELVVRRSEHEVAFRSDARWAEPLDAGLARVLRDALLAQPGVARVEQPPFAPDRPRDLELAVRVERAEGEQRAGGTGVTFVLSYELMTPTGETVARGAFRAPPREWDGQDYGALAAALSAATAEAAAAIAADLPRE